MIASRLKQICWVLQLSLRLEADIAPLGTDSAKGFVATAVRADALLQYLLHTMNFASYEVGSFYDEFLTDAKVARPGASNLMHSIQSLPPGEFARRQAAAERVLMQMGITFNVYGEQAGVEKIFPFDIVPRIVSAAEWSRLEKGLKQRIHALNLFIDDIYHEQKILNDGVVPREIILSAKSYPPAVHRLETAARHLVPYHGHRPGAAQRRADLRAGRQPPLSLRRFLRAAEPAR